MVENQKQYKDLSTDEPINKIQYNHTIEYYSAMKKSAFNSVLIRWMNLEPIIQSEVSWKEKDKYHILKCTCGIQMISTDEPNCKAALEIHTQRSDWWIQEGNEKVG